MLDDKLLVWKFNRGSINALSRIYEKYRDDMLRLAAALLKDIGDAEDIVQDVFIGFARSAGQFQLTGSLKGYLATCVANRARNRNIAAHRHKADRLNRNTGPTLNGR
jgi:RNA polymerase sigma-70 factor (ECF subfamily)